LKAPAVLAVDREPEAFADLFDAAREAGVRVGWLDLSEERARPIPAELERAAELGAMRSVHAGGGRVVTVKRIAGPTVLRDLVREHFLGCGLLLVRGLDGWPRLEATETAFELRTAPGRYRRLAARELVAELGRPRHRHRAGSR